MLNEVAVSGKIFQKGWVLEGAKQGARFLLSLYKDGDCFFIYSSFLAGKEAKEAGGTYEWFPLDPLSTSDRGSAPLGRPCSMGRVSTSGRVLCECTARATFHRRATLGLNLCGEEFSFLVRLK